VSTQRTYDPRQGATEQTDRVDCRKLARGLRSGISRESIPSEVEVGGSQLDPDRLSMAGSKAVQKSDQIDASFLWGGDTGAKGNGPLVATIYPMDRRNSDGTSQRGCALKIHIEELCICARSLPS